MSGPAWRDPRYLTAATIRRFEEHEQAIRDRERARERRRSWPLMNVGADVPSDDFEGAME